MDSRATLRMDIEFEKIYIGNMRCHGRIALLRTFRVALSSSTPLFPEVESSQQWALRF